MSLFKMWSKVRKVFDPYAGLRFTTTARLALKNAQIVSEQFRDEYVGTGHLLLAILQLDDSRAARAIEKCGVRREDALNAVTAAMHQLAMKSGHMATLGTLPHTPRLQKAVRRAGEHLGPIDTGDLLLALLEDEANGAALIVRDPGLSLELARVALAAVDRCEEPEPLSDS